ncbi:MAG: hypothetical protein WDA21_03160 [Bacilli bacterium]
MRSNIDNQKRLAVSYIQKIEEKLDKAPIDNNINGRKVIMIESIKIKPMLSYIKQLCGQLGIKYIAYIDDNNYKLTFIKPYVKEKEDSNIKKYIL